MKDVEKNAWEPNGEQQILRALAGFVDRSTYEKSINERFNQIIDWCEIRSDHRGFEIGSGEGLLASLIAPKCRAIDCADISNAFLEIAKKTCVDMNNVKFYLIEDDYLRFWQTASYDFGYSTNVFIHFNPYDIYNYLKEVKRILKPGGIFHFDAISLGPSTMNQFISTCEEYKYDPSRIRGLLNYNHQDIVKSIINEVGFDISGKSVWGDWMRLLIRK